MNDNVKIEFRIISPDPLGETPKLVISRRRKLDRTAGGTGPKESKDVKSNDVFSKNMSFSQPGADHVIKCTLDIPHTVIRRLRQKHKADLSPNNSTRKFMLCATIIVTNADGEIIAKVSKLLTE